jgi:hypothetical protein
MNLWFGKHQGKEVSELPDDYLEWLMERTSAPLMPEYFDDDQKIKVRDRWKDLLSEVEDEIFEREEGSKQPNYFA